MSEEYNNSYVQSGPNAYVTFPNYNQGTCGYALPEPYSTTTPLTEPKAIPSWNKLFTFDTLVKGGNCSGYASIVSAYTYGGKKEESMKCLPKYDARPGE